jgi:hypothetical protein
VVEGLSNRLAVECDGETWHGPDRFEDDMARQRQLERAGWTFVRIRESEFYADRTQAVHRIIRACEELGIRLLREEEREQEEVEESTSTASAKEARLLEYEEDEERDKCREAEEEGPNEMGDDLRPASSTKYSQESNFPDPHDASLLSIREALHRIIEKEGPLTKRLLIRLYVEGCPTLHRAGKTVRSLLNKALYRMQKAGEIVVVDELGDRSPESQVIRLPETPRVKQRAAGRRDLLEIPPSELWFVLTSLLQRPDEYVENDDALARAVLKHYGFTRLTRRRQEYLERVLRTYRSRAESSK